MDQVTFTAVNPNDVRQAPNEGETLSDRIARAILENGPLMHGELAIAVGTSEASIRHNLSRHKHMFMKDNTCRWTLAP